MPPREIEFKLEADPGDADTLRARLERWLGPPARVDLLLSRYYDTPAADLRGSGLTLRVRDDGAGFVQTVKRSGGGGGGLFSRDEWEAAIPSGAPDPDACRDTPVKAVLRTAAAPLAAVFRSEVERRVWTVRRPGGIVEVALDAGSVATADASVPLLEVELELKHGDVGAVVALLREVPPETRLTVGVLSKSERGFMLVDKRGDQPFKADAVALRAGMPTREGVQRILRSCLRQVRLNEPGVRARRAAALHQARVGLRRLRSAFSLFAEVMEDEAYGSLKERLRDVSRALGEARNLDVLAERLQDTRPPDGAADPAWAVLARRRAEAYDALIAIMASPSYPALLRELAAWIEAGSWVRAGDGRSDRGQEPLEAFVAGVLERRRLAIRRRGHKLRRLTPEMRHRLRIAGKKLRYAADFVATLATQPKHGRRHAALADSLESLQDALGRLHDIETAKRISADADGIAEVVAMLPHDDPEDLMRKAAKDRHRVLHVKGFWRGWAP